MLVTLAELMTSIEAVVAVLELLPEPPVRTLLQTCSTAPRRVSVPLLTSAMRLLTLPEPGMVLGRMVRVSWAAIPEDPPARRDNRSGRPNGRL
jgi:hypothetical protein